MWKFEVGFNDERRWKKLISKFIVFQICLSETRY